MQTTVNPAKGIRTIRNANVLTIISTCITMISAMAMMIGTGVGLEGMAASASLSPGAAIVAGVGLLGALFGLILVFASGIMELVGLAKNSRIHSGYKTAMILVIASIAISFIVAALSLPTSFDTIMSAFSVAISTAVVYFVISATSQLLIAKGDTVISASGVKVRNIYIICAAVSVVSDLLAFVPAIGSALDIVTVIAAIVQLVALFGYIKFLGKAAKELAV